MKKQRGKRAPKKGKAGAKQQPQKRGAGKGKKSVGFEIIEEPAAVPVSTTESTLVAQNNEGGIDFVQIFPSEISILIFSYFVNDKKALLTLSRVSHTWSSIALSDVFWKYGNAKTRGGNKRGFFVTYLKQQKCLMSNKYDVTEGNINGHVMGVNSVVDFGTNGLLSCSDDGTVIQWNTRTGETPKRLNFFSGTNWGFNALQNLDGRTRITSMRTDGTLTGIVVQEGWKNSTAYISRGPAFESYISIPHATAIAFSKSCIISAVQGTLQFRLKDNPAEVLDTVQMKGSTHEVHSYKDCTVFSDGHLVSLYRNNEAGVSLVSLDMRNTVSAIGVDHDILMCGTKVSTDIEIYDLPTQQHLHTINRSNHYQWKRGIASLAFDSWHLVSGGVDGVLRMYDLRTGYNFTKEMYRHGDTVRCIDLHGYRLTTGSSDNTILLWDWRNTTATLRRLGTLAEGVQANVCT